MLPRRASAFSAALLLALAAASSGGAQPAAQPADQEKIDQTVTAGVEYLRRTQNADGYWGSGKGAGPGKGWGVGYTALAGLTLIECGVPPDDSGLRRAAARVRSHANDLEDTYEIALVILFLDRMREKSDRQLIQFLAGRLIAGQMPSGGWGYKVSKLTAGDSLQLLGALRRMNPPPDPPAPSLSERPSALGLCIKASDDTFFRRPPPFEPARARAAALAGLPSAMKRLPVFQDGDGALPDDPKEKRHDPRNATTDNSNTHFAMLGLWAARKHDVPTARSFELVARRFRTSQGPNGTWAYDFASKGANGGYSMTCVALLGVAIGHVLDPDLAVRPEQDPLVLNSFAALSKQIGEPAGRTDGRPTVKAVGGLYFLWAMERVAVLYDVQKLGKKDWYQWGAEILVCHQEQDGSWADDGGFPGQHAVVNTCFALMFLKRANLTPDLSRRLTVDTSTLTATVDDRVTPKPEPKPESPKSTPVEEPPVEPTPPKTPAPKPAANPTPPAPTPEPTADAPPEKKSGGLLWVILGALLAALVGGFLAFLVAKRMRKDAGEEEKPRKKTGKPNKHKKKVKAEVDEDDG